jgi:hypothetical protein
MALAMLGKNRTVLSHAVADHVEEVFDEIDVFRVTPCEVEPSSPLLALDSR